MSSQSTATLWRWVQGIGLVATVALLLGLVWRPDASLKILWNVVIPLVPASLLISPMLWRNSCPLATLNMISNRLAGRRTPSGPLAAGSTTLGVALLVVLVPARHFVFNTDGPALAMTIIAVAGAAVVLGAVFDAKAGFCNAMCPVLPVERLYGQSPLVNVANSRCPSCTLCTQACLDLAPRKSIARVLGGARHSRAWLKTPFGIFAASFPGFVLGYFTTADGPLTSAASIYVRVGAWAGLSYVLAVAAVVVFRIPAARIFPALAALAVGLYYWFAAPNLAAALGAPKAGEVVLRVAALSLVAIWWWRAMRLNGARLW